MNNVSSLKGSQVAEQGDDTLISNRGDSRSALQPALPEVDERLPYLILAIKVRVAHTDECAREVCLRHVS